MRKILAIGIMVSLIWVGLAAQNIFGAFQINTVPQGANITLYGTNYFLGSTPTNVYSVQMDQFMTYSMGVPGRHFALLVTKPGYIPIKQEIFVPYSKVHQQDAIKNPTTINIYLTPQPVYAPQYAPPCPPAPPSPPHHYQPHHPPKPPTPHKPQRPVTPPRPPKYPAKPRKW